MQLRKMKWVLVAMSALGLTACARNGRDLSCSGAEDCLESEVCLPDEKVCARLCLTSKDCPSEEHYLCEHLGSAGGKICKCQTEECGGKTIP